MKILIVATGFLPYLFSENIVNGKLALAFMAEGWHVDIISRTDEGQLYANEWEGDWLPLKSNTHEIRYGTASICDKYLDTFRSMVKMGHPVEGVRWATRAYDKAMKLHLANCYDVVISRSPTDISHLVAYHFSRKTGVPWIANWNDPAMHIWPYPYASNISFLRKCTFDKYIKSAIYNAKLNTFPSEDLRDYFLHYFPKVIRDSTAVIPHIGAKYFRKHSESDSTSKILRMCHAGNLSSERNPDRLFRAIQHVNKCKGSVVVELDLMGPISKDIEEQIQSYGLTDSIKCIGSLPYNIANERMSHYDVLVIIEAESTHPVFLPSKVSDYVSLGSPILAITPRNSCISKLFSRFNCCITADSASVESITHVLDELLVAKSTNTMSSFSSEIMFAYFCSNTIINSYKELFHRIAL